ncbi:hypothetical protein N7539_004429 [Penicillium diatomitis]|uniref:Xylanolytic transcriptional activator regulatory domain-containing protein n=1 Tax=Penicillium diatomitis TaxID=2819901 RepID=A0A9X0BYG9_9EURO|nr:uncharacterized protein N7539_004429 [Penicillium diatomitis]KAJ5489539.1 hypothetical protein N7539_004429 [Penicillium diatomitis]
MFVFDSRLGPKSTSDRVSKNQHQDELLDLRQRLRTLERAVTKAGPSMMQTPGTTVHDTLSETTSPQNNTEIMCLDDRIRFLPDCNFRGKKGKTRYFGRSHWCTTLSFFQDIGAFMRHKHRNETYRDYNSMKRYKCELWARESQEQQKAFREQAFKLDELVPPRAVADQLIQLYLETFETTYRVLHVPTFLKQYADYWADLSKPDTAFLAQLLAVMAAGTRFLPTSSTNDQPNTYQKSASEWIMAVQSYISCTLISPDIDFRMIQTQVLLLLARLAVSCDAELAWTSCGTLIRSAMTMGLHRDPGRFRKANAPFWFELRRRLWTTIVELDLKISLDRGVTPSVDLDECDCPPPSDLEDVALFEEMRDDPIHRSRTLSTQNFYQCLLLESLDLRYRVAKKLNTLRFNLTYDEALRMSEELSRLFKKSVSRFDEQNSIADVTNGARHEFAQSLHRLTMQKFILALHRPFALSVAQLPKCFFSRKVCLETSLEILSEMKLPAAGESIARPHIKQLASGMLCDDLFHATITVCVELSLQAQEMAQPPGSKVSNISSSVLVSMIQSQQTVMLQAVERSLDDFGRTILCGSGKGSKPFFFLSLILASVKSRIKGEDPVAELEAASRRAVQIGSGIVSGLSYSEALSIDPPPVGPPVATPLSTTSLGFDFPSLLSADFNDLAALDLSGWFDGLESAGVEPWNSNMFADLPEL